jgi:hypothetical protein
MSRPHEPTHEEVVIAWQTACCVSTALRQLGYAQMTPKVCWKWHLYLWASDVNLISRPDAQTLMEA